MRVRSVCLFLVAVVAVRGSVHAQSVQYRSPAGIEYRAQADTGPVARAQAALSTDPRNVARIIALGIAQSGARQFREAIATFSRGIEIAPNNAILYRWRGHRYLSVRERDRALADFNRGNQLDSAVYGIWYHLGIVRYLSNDFAGAAAAFKRAQPRAPDAGELAGSTDWLWMSLSRAGRAAEAKAMLDRHPDSLPTTAAYAQRLRLYRGQINPDQVFTAADTADVQVATLSYGVGNWYLVRGDTAKARSWFERSIKSGGWPGFGFMASEVELLRLSPTVRRSDTSPDSKGTRISTLRQLGAFGAGALGLGMTVGCNNGPCAVVGAGLLWGSVGTYFVSRAWELVDVITRPIEHNAAIDAAARRTP